MKPSAAADDGIGVTLVTSERGYRVTVRRFPPPWSVEEQDAYFVGSVKKRTVADHRLSIRAVRDGEETLLFWDNRPPVGPT